MKGIFSSPCLLADGNAEEWNHNHTRGGTFGGGCRLMMCVLECVLARSKEVLR